MKTITIDNEDYEIVSDEARMLTEHLIDLKKKLGLPDTLTVNDLTPSVWKFVERLVIVWRRFFPYEYRDWVVGMENELKYERPIKQAILAGGYTPISYPMRLYNLMHVFFPNLKMQDKKFIKKFLRVVPEFKNTNYRI
mgnify:CR=1 FL=1